ncbi:MAG: PIN domain-containing protein [Spirochaetaceae bacterium]|nr:PIN domain-containing protein [Spirochaetaceae bacterium]
MSVLTVLIDTNVLIDFLIDREPFTKNAKKIVQKSQDKAINAYLAAHSITNIFYILRKIYSVSERKQRLLDLCHSISVVDIRYEFILNALANKDLDDVEDCLQSECANAINADYIVTRNIEDFAHSKVPVILPENLLKLLKTSDSK